MKITAIHVDEICFRGYKVVDKRTTGSLFDVERPSAYYVVQETETSKNQNDKKDAIGYFSVADKENNILEGLSNLNIFIGENNSGKSRFIRSFFSNDTFNVENDSKTKLKLFSEKINYVKKLYESDKHILIYTKRPGDLALKIDELIGILSEMSTYVVNNFDEIDYTNFNNNMTDVINKFITSVKNINKIELHVNRLSNDIIEESEKLIHFLIDEINFQKPPMNLKNKYYIPVLRGHRNWNTNELYKTQILKDYFGTKNLSDKVLTNETLYTTLTNKLLSTRKDRNSIYEFENYLSKTFFNNKEITITPQLNAQGNILVNLNNEKTEHELHNFGDGLNNLISVLFPLFQRRNEFAIICIEEPETHLHPGMQRILVESLMNKNYFPYFQYFITTHSNHFLDLALEFPNDISIYHFQKKNIIGIEYFEINPTTADDIKVLDSLGVRNSSVFLSNCTIWVEGITDRLYLKKYLELYQEYLLLTDNNTSTYHEDLHYSFFEYAGSNIVHWDFNYNDDKKDDVIKALKISNRVFLIADTDDTEIYPESEKAKRLKRFEKLNTDKVIKFKRVPTIEIDNTIHEEILTLATNDIDTHSNSNVVASFTNYQDNRLGTYIDNTFYNGVKTFANSDKEKSEGKTYTIKSDKKLKLCKKAVQLMQTNWENAKDKIQNKSNVSEIYFQEMVKMTPVAFELGKEIYDFIKEHNSK